MAKTGRGGAGAGIIIICPVLLSQGGFIETQAAPVLLLGELVTRIGFQDIFCDDLLSPVQAHAPVHFEKLEQVIGRGEQTGITGITAHHGGRFIVHISMDQLFAEKGIDLGRSDPGEGVEPVGIENQVPCSQPSVDVFREKILEAFTGQVFYDLRVEKKGQSAVNIFLFPQVRLPDRFVDLFPEVFSQVDPVCQR